MPDSIGARQIPAGVERSFVSPAFRTRSLAEESESRTLVELRQVGRTYRRGKTSVVALTSVDCVIRPGQRVALMGASGSGKSTLLHLMGGLDAPTSGTISWPDLGSLETLRPSKIAVVFQMPSLLPPLSVVENVELPLLLDRVAPDVARRAALDALARIDLGAIADKIPEELSGGQAQRVAVARALAYHPKLILADEPTGQLDHPTAQHVFDALLAALEGTSTALVVATHDPAIAGRLSDVWHVRHGKLEGETR